MKKKIGLPYWLPRQLLLLSLLLMILFNYRAFFGYYHNFRGNSFYDDAFYSDALSSYNSALFSLPSKEFYYNKSNSYYKIGQEQEDIFSRLFYYELSLEGYKKILLEQQEESDFYERVEYNYDFVKRKIDELMQEQEEKQKEQKEKQSGEKKQEQNDQLQQKNDTQSNQQGEKENENIESNESLSDPQNSVGNDEQEAGSENIGEEQKGFGSQNQGTDSNQKTSLDPATKSQIDVYMQNLQNNMQQYMQFFNKKEESRSSVQDSFFHRFSGDPFFDNLFDQESQKDR